MATPNAPPFVAVELKNTHHVLGLLLREADASGGGDLALLAPDSLSVRAPITDPAPNPSVTPLELHVPPGLLQATTISGATLAQRDQAFSKPLSCVVAGSTVAQVPAGANPPTFTFNASAGGLVTQFDVILPVSVGEDVPYSVVIEEAKPAPNSAPFMRITESTIAAGDNGQISVLIRSGAGAGSPPNPVPANTWVYVMVAVPGYPLALKTVQTPA
jgi:hypothetical protein